MANIRSTEVSTIRIFQYWLSENMRGLSRASIQAVSLKEPRVSMKARISSGEKKE